MEIRAVIEGLGALKERCSVTVRTDSQYVKNGITKWILNWKANGWVHKIKGVPGKQPIKNRDLWEELDDSVKKLLAESIVAAPAISA